MALEVKIVHENAILPRKNHWNDAGFDLFCVTDIMLAPWSQSIWDTGLELASLPRIKNDNEWDTVMQIWPRSGLAAKFGVETGAGVIDANYRGPILVLLKNESDSVVEIPYGKAMAQALIVPVYTGEIVAVESSNETDRGSKGGITAVRGGSQGFIYGRTE